MCDYSLHAVASRPAKVGERLISTSFPRTSTRGFAVEGERDVAVCLMPGTELGFNEDVKYQRKWIWSGNAGFSVARFRKLESPPMSALRGPHRMDTFYRHYSVFSFALAAIAALVVMSGVLVFVEALR